MASGGVAAFSVAEQVPCWLQHQSLQRHQGEVRVFLHPKLQRLQAGTAAVRASLRPLPLEAVRWAQCLENLTEAAAVE